MFADAMPRCLRIFALLLFLGIVYSPLVALLLELPRQQREDFALSKPTGRHGPLLASSIALAAVVSATATIVSLPAASALVTGSGRWKHAISWLVAAMVAVPPYIHTLTWATPLACLRSTGVPAGWESWFCAGWVQTMSLLPVGFCLSLLAWGAVEQRLVSAALLSAPPVRVLRRIILPLLAPGVLLAAAFIFLLSLVDYSIPSLYAIATYALEIFAEYSGNAIPARALLVALPLVAAAGAAAALLVAPLRAAATRTVGGAPRAGLLPVRYLPAWWRRCSQLALGVVITNSALVLWALLRNAAAPANVLAAVILARRELVFSLLLGAVAAAAGALLSFPAARKMIAGSRSASWWWALAVLPLAIPAPLTGVGLVALWNRPAGDMVYGTAAMPLLAALARFLPVAAVIQAAFLRRTDARLLDAGRIFARTRTRRILCIDLPVHAPGLLAAAGIIFALTLGEIGATLVVAPPGMATLAMRIYNYLHYGASETVASLCLVTALGAMAGGWLLVQAMRGAARG